MLDVNVECLDSASKWSLSKVKQNLSQGVPALDQGKHHFQVDNGDDGDENVQIEFFSSGPLTAELGNGGDPRSTEIWQLPTPKLLKMDSTPLSPGTPSTSSTSCTERQFQGHSQTNGRDDPGGEDSEQAIASPPLLNLPPSFRQIIPMPIESSHSAGTESIESITSPQMRDQLNYYIGKHVTSSPSKMSSTPKAFNGQRQLQSTTARLSVGSLS